MVVAVVAVAATATLARQGISTGTILALSLTSPYVNEEMIGIRFGRRLTASSSPNLRRP